MLTAIYCDREKTCSDLFDITTTQPTCPHGAQVGFYLGNWAWARLETLEIKRDWPMAAIFAPLHFEENMNY